MNLEKFISEELSQYDNLKDKIVYRLINAEKNKELLERVAYEPFFDLAIVFHLLLEVRKEGVVTLIIKEAQRKKWGVTVKELLAVAHNNTEKLMGLEFKNINEVMKELTADETNYIDDKPMYVLTNRMRNFGSSALLYAGMLETIRKKMNGGYYILPSSIHEIIIVPQNIGVKRSTLKEMVAEINETQLAPNEVLSNNVYYYDEVSGCELRILE